MAAFHKQLVAAQKLLRGLVNLPSFADVQRRQCADLLRCLEKVQELSTEDAGGILESLDDGLWGEHSTRLRAGLANKNIVLENSKERKGLQDYTLLVHYLTQYIWDQIRLKPGRVALELVCKQAGKLGLKNPSEPTMGVLFALAFDVGGTMQMVEKYEITKQSRALVKKILAQALEPPEHLLQLPFALEQVPAHFLQQAFSDEAPPIETDLAAAVLANGLAWPMRSTHSFAAAPALPSQSSSGLDLHQLGSFTRGLLDLNNNSAPDIGLKILKPKTPLALTDATPRVSGAANPPLLALEDVPREKPLTPEISLPATAAASLEALQDACQDKAEKKETAPKKKATAKAVCKRPGANLKGVAKATKTALKRPAGKNAKRKPPDERERLLSVIPSAHRKKFAAGCSKWTRVCQRRRNAYTAAHPCLKLGNLPRGDGSGTVPVAGMSLPMLVQAKANACVSYRRHLAEALKRNHNKLTLVFYCDEVTGGNVLSPTQGRKSNVTYVTWLEFPVLFDENMWLTLSVVRSCDIAAMAGGMAALVRKLLEDIRLETQNGFPVCLDDSEPDMVLVERVIFLADHEAIRAATGAKGASGLKPCIKCLNVLAHGKSAGIPNHFDVTSADLDKFWKQTDQTVQEAFDLMTGCRTRAAREDKEKFLGWNLEQLSAGPLTSPVLQDWLKMADINFDAMHIYFSNGLIAQELGLWWTCVTRKTEVTLSKLAEYASLWHLAPGGPGAKLPRPEKMFIAKLWRQEQDFRGDATMTAVVLSICQAFCRDVLANSVAMAAEIASLSALLSLVLAIYETKFDSSAVNQLLDRQRVWLQCHKIAYGEEHIRPKCHYAWHLTEQVSTVGKMLDCFTAERKHKGYKALAAGNTSNQPDFATTALLELVERELQPRSKQTSQLNVELLGKPTSASVPGLPGPAQVGTGLNVCGVAYLKNGWVIVTKDCAVHILAGLLWNEQHFLLVQVYIPARATDGLRTAWAPHLPDKLALLQPNELNKSARVVLFRREENDIVWLLR
eukprot:Skav226442  [mRNA]  locus=scaffold2660:315472:323305:- [translate_table: standard]